MNDLILKARLHEQNTTSHILFNNFSKSVGGFGTGTKQRDYTGSNAQPIVETPQQKATNASQDIRPGAEEMERRANSDPNAEFGMSNMGDAMDMFNTSAPTSDQNQRVRTGGAVRNTLGAVRDAGSAIAGGNFPTATNRAAAQRENTGMTSDQQARLVGEQNAASFTQREESKTAGQNAAYSKLMQNAPGLASDEAKDTMGDIQGGQDALANSQTGTATGGATTGFVDRFKTGVGNLAEGVGTAVSMGVDAYNNANPSVGTGSAGQGIPQASPAEAETTGTPVSQGQPQPNAAALTPPAAPATGEQTAQNQQYNLGDAATRAAGDKAIASNQKALTDAEKRSNTKGGFATNPYLGLLTGGVSNVLGAGYNAWKRGQGRNDMANAKNQQSRLMTGDTTAIQASEDILNHFYGIQKSRLYYTDRGSTEAIRLAYR